MKSVFWILPSIAGCLIVGCNAPSEPAVSDGEPKTLSERVESALGDVSSAAQRHVEEQAEKLLAALDRQVETLRDQAAESAEESARKAFDTVRMELEEKRDEVRDKLAALRDDTGGAREELRRDLSGALAELRDLVENAAESVEHAVNSRNTSSSEL